MPRRPVTPSSPPLAAFGQQVRQRRQDLGLSQEALADRAGLHRTYVGDVERGERDIALLNIVALADALDCTAAELIEVPSDRD